MHTRLICESLPDAELVLLKGDHFIAARKPQEFNRAVEHFWRKKMKFNAQVPCGHTGSD